MISILQLGEPNPNSFCTGPHLPDPDADRPRGAAVEDETHTASFATGGKHNHPSLRNVRTRRLADPSDPYGPEGTLVGDDPSSMAAEVLRQRYETDAHGNPNPDRITVTED